MRLDPYTLRQAAARWPRETLSPRAAQSFLKSLAEEAEAQRPATVHTFMGAPVDLHDIRICPVCWSLIPSAAEDWHSKAMHP
jgi:hypothetical protein